MKFVKQYAGNYTTISNEVLRDKEISNGAKGLFVFLWSCSDEFHITLKGLQKVCKDGRDAIANQLHELEKAGYLKRTQIKNTAGRFVEYQYNLRDQKAIPFFEKPCSGNPNTESQNAKEILIEEVLNKETTASNSSSHSSTKGCERAKKEEERGQEKEKRQEKRSLYQRPIYDEVAMYVREHGYQMDAYTFWTYYDKRGWQANGEPMKDWRKCCDKWEVNDVRGRALAKAWESAMTDIAFDFIGAMGYDDDGDSKAPDGGCDG